MGENTLFTNFLKIFEFSRKKGVIPMQFDIDGVKGIGIGIHFPGVFSFY